MKLVKKIFVSVVLLIACMSADRVGAQTVALRNNLLYDATLTPNLGADIRVDSLWTIGAFVGLNAWDIDKDKNKKWRHLLISPNVRRWLGDVPFHKSYVEGDLIYSHFNVGNTKIPFVALIISGMVNVLLNMFFVIILDRTVDGVAAATVISNLFSSIILLHFLRHTDTAAKFDVKKLRVSRSILGKILKIGIPAAIQAMVFSSANIIIQSAINSLGTLVMAASSAAFNIEIFSYYVLNSFGQACTTFTGQNYGAKKIDRCKKTLKLCILEGIVIEGLMVLFLLLFGKHMIALFRPDDPELVEIGYIRVMFITTAHLFSLFYDVMSGYMRGYGISLSPALVTMVTICGTRIFWIYCVFANYHTFPSIMIVYPISLGLNSIAIFILLLIKRPAKKLGKPQTA